MVSPGLSPIVGFFGQTRGKALSLACLLGLSGCASYRIKRDIRRENLAAVQAASSQARARLSPKWRRRYAKLLSDRGQVQAAQLWWLGSYLRGADLRALEDLALSHLRSGQVGFAAAHFAQIVATQRGALHAKAQACETWRQRKQARVLAGAFVSAQRDERRLRALCGEQIRDSALARQAGEQRMRRARVPELIDAFAPALMPAFLDPQWQKGRLGQVSMPPSTGQGNIAGMQDPVARSILDSLGSTQGVQKLGPWLSGASKTQKPGMARQLLAAIGRDPTLGSQATALCALLGASGHTRALAIVQDNLRASSSLQSEPSAQLRVVLALVQGRREDAIFSMRLGASQVEDLGAWWLWCARWAQLTHQDAATKVAYQALTKLVAPQSPARWTLSWWRLRQKILEFPVDPYLKADAPSSVARASLRSFWTQFLASLPDEVASGVWPALVDDLVQQGWRDQQIRHLGMLLFASKGPAGWEREILVSRAKLLMVRKDPTEALGSLGPAWRRLAWRRLWASAGVNTASLARYWELLKQDPAWSPTVDPFAALSVLFSVPNHWSVQD